MKYQRIQRKDGSIKYRSQPRDPVTGGKLTIEADTLDELKERLKRVKDVRAEMKWGGLEPKAAIQRIRPATQTGQLTVKTLWERYEKTLKPKALKLARQNWTHLLCSTFGHLSPFEVTRDKMSAWEAAMVRQGYAPKTIVNAYDHLAGCFRRAIDAGTVEDLPWGTIARALGGSGWRPSVKGSKKTVQFVGTLEQFMALLGAAKRRDEKQWQKSQYSDLALRIAVMVLTGMRTAEAAGLAWDCVEIDREPGILRVICQAGRAWNKAPGAGSRPKEQTKGRKVLTQALHPNASALLRMHRSEMKKRGWYRPDGPVFPGVAGAWRTGGKLIVPTVVKELAKVCGFPRPEDWTVHSLRHSFATLEVKSSGDIKRTQARTGHSSSKQLEGYLHASGDFLGSTAIPVLPIRLDPMMSLPDGTAVTLRPKKAPADVDADPWGFESVPAAPEDIVLDSAARQYDEDRRESARTLRAEGERPFNELAAEWLSQPVSFRSGVPEAVKAAANRHYHQAYTKEHRAGGKPKQCQQAGMRKRRATMGAWARAVTIQERRVSGELSKNTEANLEP